MNDKDWAKLALQWWLARWIAQASADRAKLALALRNSGQKR